MDSESYSQTPTLDLTGGVEAEVVPEDYSWAADEDEQRRCFVFEYMASPDIDANILLQNMEMCVQWLKLGVLPSVQDKKRTLKSINGT